MYSLCILNLSHTSIKKLPDSLSVLVNLKGLLLGWCQILEYVPYLGHLKKLQELDLEQTGIQELPQGVEELTDLRFLSLYACWKLEMFPKYLLKNFPYLQCVLLPEHIEAPVEEIEKLKHLGEFRGRVKDAFEFNRLISGQQYLSYSIIVGSRGYFPIYRGYNQLTFTMCDLKDVDVLAEGIQHLYLRDCKGLSNCLLESLAQMNIDPRYVKSLEIGDCDEIQCLWRIDRGGVTSTSTSTSAPPPLPPPRHARFLGLSTLNIYGCHKMLKLGILASQLQNLITLTISDCEMLEQIMEVPEDIGGGESRESSVVSLPKLRHLILCSLPRLKSLCNSLVMCYSIEEIELKKCPALKKLPLVFGDPNNNSPPLALDRVNLHAEDKEWCDNLELGHDTGTIRSLIRPFLYFEQEVTSGSLSKAELDEEVSDVTVQGRHFEELLDDVYGIEGDMLSTNRLVGEECLENLENILTFLLDDKVPSVGICGLGGVGKTILAKHINNRLLKFNHESVFWITVSLEFTIKRLQDEIAKLIDLDFSTEQNEDLRALRLKVELSKRKNLIFIFDDVWEYLDMKKLGDPLCGNGCKLLITTRSIEVCDQFHCKIVIVVKTLKEIDAWKLFNATIGMSLTSEVNEIAKCIVNLCDGWPLGIITIAGSMKGETDFHVWKDALAELTDCVQSQQDMNEMAFKVLKCCFDRLGSSVDKNYGYSLFQMCFLYCSLYPKMDRNTLIKNFILWVFPDKGESGEALFEHAHSILDKLENAHLLEGQDNGQVRMHDLVRDMALKVIEDKTKVIAEHYSLKEIPETDLEKTSLMNDSTAIPDGVSPNHSMALLDSKCLEFIPKLTYILHYSLCILDLSRTNIMKLPDSLSKFVNLKGLILKECQQLVYVPWLGDLKELRQLDFTLTALQEVPQGMEQLVNLEFLSLDKAYQLEMLPRGLLLNFPNLQRLHLPYHIHVSGEEVAKLKHLEEFRGRVKDASDFFKLIRSRNGLAYGVEVRSGLPCYRLDEFKAYNQLILSRYNFEEAKAEDMDLLKQGVIRHVKLHACEGHFSCLVEDLLLMSYPWLIESLEVYTCEKIKCLSRGAQFLGLKGAGAVAVASTSVCPPLAQAIFFSLKQLEIFYCNNMKRLGLSASDLPNLEKITVAYCEDIEDVIEADEGQEKASVVSLPKLRCIFLEDLPRLKSVCNATMVCSSLEVISMRGCQSLLKLPLVFNPSDYGSPPSALRSIWISKVEMEWWQKLELGHPTYHRLLQPFITF